MPLGLSHIPFNNVRRRQPPFILFATGVVGLEPTAANLEDWYSIQLSYTPIRLIKKSGMLTTQPGGNLKVLWNLQPEPLDFIEL